jgi:hypothetical protein
VIRAKEMFREKRYLMPEASTSILVKRSKGKNIFVKNYVP